MHPKISGKTPIFIKIKVSTKTNFSVTRLVGIRNLWTYPLIQKKNIDGFTKQKDIIGYKVYFPGLYTEESGHSQPQPHFCRLKKKTFTLLSITEWWIIPVSVHTVRCTLYSVDYYSTKEINVILISLYST